MSTQFNELTPEEKHIIRDKGTERPFSGELLDEHREGTFICKQCGAPLYYSDMKFDSGCGWPSFDDAIPGQVKETVDADGRRTEITCMSCGGHLGHVFRGERMTSKNTRHCVNSLSMRFVPEKIELQEHEELATFGGGCYRCLEAVFQRLRGVHTVESGFMGGESEGPTYEEVCRGESGHVEVVQIRYDPEIISYTTLLRVFFSTHDPTQLNRQGNDVGTQYASIIFTHTSEQQKEANEMIGSLNEAKVYFPDSIVTQVRPAEEFWKAEGYHQNFYNDNQSKPYCQMIITPKVRHLREQWSDLLKDEE